MINLTGSYECKVDAKGRLMLPTGMKKQLQSVMSGGFVMKKNAYYNCLELYPMTEWDKVVGKIHRLNQFVKEASDFIRKFTAGYKFIELDTAGRILIPKDLAAFSGVKKEVVLTAVVNRIEIWDKKQYDEWQSDESVDVASLAEKYMTDLNEEKGEN